MKLVKLLNLMVLASGVAIFLAGCATGVQNPKRIPGATGNPGDEALGGGRRVVLLPPPETGTRNPNPPGETVHPPREQGHIDWQDDAMALKSQSTYFDLDKSSFKASEQAKLEEVASFLKNNPTKDLRVEGNCDERGTEEYNRSLGERRALAAREYLIRSGIDPQRIETLSNGEDKPAAVGHSEKFWSKNRRDDFIVLTPPK